MDKPRFVLEGVVNEGPLSDDMDRKLTYPIITRNNEILDWVKQKILLYMTGKKAW